MRTKEAGIAVGDYVQLHARELPHHDNNEWWWRVMHLGDLGLDVIYPAGRQRSVTRRGVSVGCVRAHRQPNEAA